MYQELHGSLHSVRTKRVVSDAESRAARLARCTLTTNLLPYFRHSSANSLTTYYLIRSAWSPESRHCPTQGPWSCMSNPNPHPHPHLSPSPSPSPSPFTLNLNLTRSRAMPCTFTKTTDGMQVKHSPTLFPPTYLPTYRIPHLLTLALTLTLTRSRPATSTPCPTCAAAGSGGALRSRSSTRA